MVEELILRIVDPKYRELQLKIADVLKSELKISLVDESILKAQFDHVFVSYEKVICLSEDIVIPDGIEEGHVSFFKISRVFSEEGKHIGWFIPSISESLIKFDSPFLSQVYEVEKGTSCVVDSDVATGSTSALILRFFPGSAFFAPIQLSPRQDLLDIEDLFLARSLMSKNEQLSSVNYLVSESFFCSRTSISAKKYKQILKLVKEELVRLGDHTSF